ncbi:MAG: hypothetical protein AAF865_04680 [Pseudomonadota bacterium]
MNTPSFSFGDHLSRFFRILFSVLLSSLAAMMMATFLYSDTEAHYTYRAAGPFFLLGLFFWVWVAICIAVSFEFFRRDRRTFDSGSLYTRRRVGLLIAWVAGILFGFLTPLIDAQNRFLAILPSLIGYCSLFFLFYWVMTGRVAGRSGWSIRDFPNTKWDEQLYIVVALVCAARVLIALLPLAAAFLVYCYGAPSSLGTPPFQTQFQREMTPGIDRALRKFPDAQSCLENGADAGRREDLRRMNWDRIDTRGDATVCTFRLLHRWGPLSEADRWLEAQGLQLGQGFNSRQPYTEPDGRLRLSANWSIQENGPRYPTSGLFRRVFRATAHSMNVSAWYSPDGRDLLYVRLSFLTL